MRIARLTLHNWICFRGTNAIELGGKVYAVTANKNGNSAASNWAGKSSFLKSIRFALFGEHDFLKEDMWITRGEDEGYVELETDDGLIIRRSRIKNKSTQLIVTDGNQSLRKDEAQARIVQRVGLTSDDFQNTSYFAQRAMSRFITTKPDERQSIITSWFKLEPVEACEASVREEARAAQDEAERLQGDLRGKRSVLEQTLSSVQAKEVSDIIARKHSLREELPLIQTETHDASEILSLATLARASWDRDQQDAKEYSRIVQDGQSLKAKLEALKAELEASPPPSLEELAECEAEFNRNVQLAQQAYAALSTARDEAKQKQALSKGEFDGLCPVAGIECPAREAINAPRRRNLEMYDEAKAKEAAVRAAHQSAQDAQERARVLFASRTAARADARLKQSRIETIEGQLASLRVSVKQVEAGYKRAATSSAPSDGSEGRSRLQNAQARLLERQTSLRELERAEQTVLQLESAILTLVSKATEAQRVAGLYREAVAIFGRNGAQKRIAEGNLLDMEGGANELLRTCMIDLNIAVQWNREGNGLATECDTCGTSFPASQRVKKCEKCGTERGPKLVNKLDLVLSDRSGAAEDLSGISFQLSASAWLRHDRGSAWGTALLDEPFTALDEENRKALATHLATMLRGQYGYEQSFIVAHQKEVMESLPARVEITSNGSSSTLRVVG